ncbi:hypothetical protein [Kitasatospora sp. NPDC088346]|uniref:hypothetical protein n=1 Tax=Kitasatospora sp. NPDC088346 TaxID=3364073 RepID=UPI00380F3073
MWRGLARAAAVLAAVACLVGTGAGGWLLTGERMGAALGIGPPGGDLVVARCYQVYDTEGYDDGRDCRGDFTPAGGSADAVRPMVLRGAAADHRPGTRLAVRLSHGAAYEPSAEPAVKYGIAAGLVLVVGGTLAAWLFACARHGRLQDGEGYVFAALAGLVGVPLLGIAVGVVAGLLEAVF